MSIFTLGSNNPNFSHIIAKNPVTISNTGTPFQRDVRKGRVYGWFSKLNNQEFRLLFRDSELESSFVDQGEFEYLDKSRYSSPYAPIQMINEALRSASKGGELDVGGFEAYGSFLIKIPTRLHNRLRFNAPSSISFETLYDNYQKVTIKAEKVSEILNLTNVVCILATLMEDDFYLPLGFEVLSKYLRSLQEANAPYYLRHLLISRTFSNIKTFNDAVEAGLIHTPTMQFQYGNTQVHRLNAIKGALGLMKGSEIRQSLIDVGCGEMFHSLKLQTCYANILAIDADEEVTRINGLKLAKRQVDNITPIHANVTGSYIAENPGLFSEADVLLSEILEHNAREVSAGILAEVLAAGPNMVVVTVPNQEFNKYYDLDSNEFRHPDHVWEPTREQFIQFIMAHGCADFQIEISGVGDVVEGVPCSLMAVFKKV
jgi:hypothetical protein